jgi:hypothetical protein
MEPNQPQPTDVPSAAANNPNSLQPVIITPTSPAPRPLDVTPLPSDSSQPVVSPAATEASAPAAFQPTVSAAGAAQPAYMSDSTQPAPSLGAPAPRPQKGLKAKITKRRLRLAGVVVVLGLAAGAVFGWYLPNTPGNVWSTGMNRSGSALDSFAQTALSAKQLAAYKTSTVNGTAQAHFGGATYSGNFNASFDSVAMNGGATFDMQSKLGDKKTITAKLLSQVPTGKLYPDVYLQVSGLKTLGLDALFPSIAAYDGQWMTLSSDYLQSIGGSVLAGSASGSEQVSAADVASLVKTASNVTKDYLFTTNSAKAVLVKKAFVGKETVDGLSTYHYTVGINSAHARDYCVALANALVSTTAYQHVAGKSGSQLDTAKKSATDECASYAADSVTANDTLDVWVDGHYKLIYKIRSYEDKSQNSYTDIGQLYKGGNAVSLFVVSHDGTSGSGGKFTLNANLDTTTTKATYTLKGGGSSPYDMTVALTLAASDKPVTITKPANATPVQTLLGGLGMGETGATASSAGAAATSTGSTAASSNNSASTSAQDNVDNTDEADIGQASQTDDTAS